MFSINYVAWNSNLNSTWKQILEFQVNGMADIEEKEKNIYVSLMKYDGKLGIRDIITEE